MQWQDWRHEFPILTRKTYLNSCSLGALSHRAEARVRQFHDDWHSYGASAWYETWMGRLAELRARVARMLGAADGAVALAHSTSGALASIASSIDYSRRNKVVIAELDFPTLAYQWLNRPDVEVVFVPSDDGATIDPERFAAVVDERTALVATSHVFYATGAIQDLAALAGIAHDKGALFLVDGYQSVGQVPVDLGALDVDIFVAGPLKWLLGGPGLCYLYVRPELVPRLTPAVTGWFGAQNQFGFDIRHFEFKDDARRFEMGTPALHMVHSALGGQEIIDEVSVPAIRARNQQLTELLIDSARRAGYTVRGAQQPDARSAIVMIATSDPAGAVAHLADRDIIIDWRPGHVRVSPHFYNLESEIELVMQELNNWRDRHDAR
ncbi:MAG TPA: aminotransferase class V-fold PLP-dependent enzyme [Longimicrobiales bacterium]